MAALKQDVLLLAKHYQVHMACKHRLAQAQDTTQLKDHYDESSPAWVIKLVFNSMSNRSSTTELKLVAHPQFAISQGQVCQRQRLNLWRCYCCLLVVLACQLPILHCPFCVPQLVQQQACNTHPPTLETVRLSNFGQLDIPSHE